MDYSFLKLHKTFEEAKSTDLTDSQYLYYNGVVLSPDESYLQITNNDFDIAFDESYLAEIVDCEENVLLDITDKVYIFEFQDNDGLQKLAFEITPIKDDFYFKNCYLRLKHLNSELVVYSNQFILTNELEGKTFRLDYKSYSNYEGVNYVIADFYQSIRLAGYYNGLTPKEDSKVYTEINGKIRKSRVIQSTDSSFLIDRIDDITLQKLSIALNNDLVYINGNRAITADSIKVGERQGKTNLFDVEFTSQIRKNEKYIFGFQIAPPLDILDLQPKGLYTQTSILSIGYATFNQNIILGNGKVKLYNYDTDVKLFDLDINVSSNLFNFTMPTLPNGYYYFLFEENLINDNLGRTLSITNKEVWSFKIQDADFINNDFNNSDFFTN